MSEIKVCPVCNGRFERSEDLSDYHWNLKKYCSVKCKRTRDMQKYRLTSKGKAVQRESLKRYDFKNKCSLQKHERGYLAPPVVVGPEFQVVSNNILVTSDWHIPFVNRDTFELFLVVAEEESVYDLVIGGDFWDMDEISSYHDSLKVALDKEIEYVKHYLSALMTRFDRIWICSGNHERRWAKWMKGKLDTQYLFNLTGLPLKEVNITSRDYLLLNDYWRVCHAKNYSQTPCRVAKKLALKYEANILNAHGHFCEESYVYVNPYRREKRFYVADIGGFFDKDKINYMLNTTTYPDLDNGFCLLQDGQPQLFRMKDYKD